MLSSPSTPTRRRGSSNHEPPSFFSSKQVQDSPIEKRSEGRFSTHSFSSPSSIRSPIQHDDSLDPSKFNGAGNPGDDFDGLGNLAEELAEAWDNEGSHSPQVDSSVITSRTDGAVNGCNEHRGRPTFVIHPEMGIGMPSVSYDGANDSRSLSPPKPPLRSRPQRKSSNISDYDGSDYGDNSDFEIIEGISASMEHRLAAIESLARRGTESNGSGSDDAVMRVAMSLRDLRSQADVEIAASRLMTAHAAVASNLAHQTRVIQTLSYHLASPFSVPPAPEEIDGVLPLLAAALELLPPPNPRAINSLHNLQSSAIEMIATLSTLADNLHMLRQTTSLAARRLKTAKDAADELRREGDLREEGIRWVERGNWDAKLKNRGCAAACKDVVSGFRSVCEGWETTIHESAKHYSMEIAS